MIGKRILLVEDEEILRFLYEVELGDEGYEVVTAKNGKEALLLLEKTKPHLVILDIIMPKMDGLEALPRIKEKHSGLPVIVYTSHPGYLSSPKASAADACILKKSDLGELKEKVRHLLNESAEDPFYGRRNPW